MDSKFQVAEFQRDGKTMYAVVDEEEHLMGVKYPGQLAPLPCIYLTRVTAKIVARQLNKERKSQEATWESLTRGFVDYPEPDQAHGAAD